MVEIDTAAERERVTRLWHERNVYVLTHHAQLYLDAYDRLRAENQRLREAVDEVRDLIKESGGVWGLHRNGDDAPWADLLPGGRYETWLLNLGELAGLPEGAVESTGGGDS